RSPSQRARSPRCRVSARELATTPERAAGCRRESGEIGVGRARKSWTGVYPETMSRASLWGHREFVKLLTGQAISQIGSRITRTALPFAAAITLNAGPFQMGILSGAAGVSVLLFGLFAGAWADRLRRRPILIWTDLGRAAVLAIVPIAAMRHS